ncbi:hypothetical protein HanIR_Chr13g0653901 [Helianthus annuus]|nr:hypothetical protein HanIR_Chr13g0653901 [Helianthus annuus]
MYSSKFHHFLSKFKNLLFWHHKQENGGMLGGDKMVRTLIVAKLYLWGWIKECYRLLYYN